MVTLDEVLTNDKKWEIHSQACAKCCDNREKYLQTISEYEIKKIIIKLIADGSETLIPCVNNYLTINDFSSQKSMNTDSSLENIRKYFEKMKYYIKSKGKDAKTDVSEDIEVSLYKFVNEYLRSNEHSPSKKIFENSLSDCKKTYLDFFNNFDKSTIELNKEDLINIQVFGQYGKSMQNLLTRQAQLIPVVSLFEAEKRRTHERYEVLELIKSYMEIKEQECVDRMKSCMKRGIMK